MFALRTTETRPTHRLRVLGLAVVIALVTVVTAFDYDDGIADALAPAAEAAQRQALQAAALQADEDNEPVAEVVVGPAIDELTLTSIGEFVAPVEVIVRPGDERIFVVGLMGSITVVTPDADEPTATVLDISEQTLVEGEHGLLGAAFHPIEPLLYVHYSNEDGDSIIAEFEVDPETGIADPETERLVLAVGQPFNNHNGGEMTFGPDGLLYLGFGDGGLANDPARSALDLTSRLGKILRINPVETDDAAYSIPTDNPFIRVGVPNSDGELVRADPTIWSYGLRNPWRFSFDAETGDLWIADVGQDKWEEINFAAGITSGPNAGLDAGRGMSFGWSAFEGEERFNEDQNARGHIDPLVVYERAEGLCSVSGGAVYRGDSISALDGWYVYGDYCTGQVFGFDTTLDAEDREIVQIATSDALVAVASGADGELYVVSVGGTVSRLG